MIEEVLIEIAIILVVGLIMSGVAVLFKQPMVIGYILAGIILGPNLLNIAHSSNILGVFAELGSVLLLFVIGLNLSPKVFREVGKISLFTGLGQIIFTSIFGFAISMLLGFPIYTSIFVAVALTLSSTIIIVKILSDKGDTDTLYGKITMGFLLVQDIAAMIALTVVSSLGSRDVGSGFGLLNVVQIIAVTAALFPISIYILPRIMKKVSKHQEYLLLFSLGWCMLIAVIFHKVKFSMEIGALIAGVTLSVSAYRYEIMSKVKSIRDFLIFLFFVYIGLQMDLSNVGSNVLPVIVFSLFVLIGNPLIVIAIMGRLGYTKKTSFYAGLTVAQVSEFSLILVTLGVKSGMLTPEIQSMVTVVALITIAGSTYMMMHADGIYVKIAKLLSIFERKEIREVKPRRTGSEHDIILFGYDKIGYSICKLLKKLKHKFLIVDHNPIVINHLTEKRIKCTYGDAEDGEMLDELKIQKAKMVISTIPDYHINSLILRKIREHSDDIIVIMVCNSIEDSLKLYDAGVSYVIIPRFLGGEHASYLIEEHGFDLDKFITEKASHIEQLGDRKSIKHFQK